MKTFGLSSLCLLLAVPAFACDVPEGFLKMKADEPSSLSVYLNAGEDGVKLGQPFNLDVMVCSEGETSISIERLNLDATMPAHQHGMNYTPEISQVSDMAFTASGLLFHMPGIWRYNVKVFTAEGREDFTLDYAAK